jgi:cysteine desulfuration protein SufE
MSTLHEREANLEARFSQFKHWEDKYRAIIEMGRTLPPFPEDRRNEDHRIKGCQSQVWLWAEPDQNNKIQVFADSDALITKGLVALVVYLYSGATASEIMGHSLEIFKKLGLFDHLSPSRANGFHNMLKQIKNYAVAYHLKGY